MSYNQYQSNPYNQGPSAESGYGHGGYGGQEQHELQEYGQQAPQGAPTMDQSQYLGRVSQVRNEIKSLTADVRSIASLHQRALAGNDPSADAQLNNLVSSTQLKNTSIRDQIRLLKADCERTRDASFGMKKRQFETLNSEFKREVESYLQEEKQYKERYRDQIARQYRIVNPAATEEEVRQAANADWGDEGIFQQALRTNRSGQANAVLGAVRARHNELQRIEQSIVELAGLFNDLDTVVVMQEATVTRVEEQTEQANTHLQNGNVQVQSAIKSARNRRKYFWWCMLVVLLILIAIGLGVGLGIKFAQGAAPKK